MHQRSEVPQEIWGSAVEGSAVRPSDLPNPKVPKVVPPGRVPHGLEFPVAFNGFHKLHAPFVKERRTRGLVRGSLQEIRGVCTGVAGALRGLNKMGRSPSAVLFRVQPICNLADIS